MRVLVSWIGHTDLQAMAPGESAAIQIKLKELMKRKSLEVPLGGMGPVKTLLQIEGFDRVHLLSNYPKWANTRSTSGMTPQAMCLAGSTASMAETA